MAYDMTVIERLEQDLNNADAEREKLQEELDGLKEHATWGWSRHTEIAAGNDKLPVPRLQMTAINVSGDWYVTDFISSMVYKHFLGHHVIVPIGHTRRTGGSGGSFDGRLPFRDGAHIKHDARMFNWPAFLISDGNATLIELED